MNVRIWPIISGYSMVDLFILTLEKGVEAKMLTICHIQLFVVAFLRLKSTSKCWTFTFTPIYTLLGLVLKTTAQMNDFLYSK